MEKKWWILRILLVVTLSLFFAWLFSDRSKPGQQGDKVPSQPTQAVSPTEVPETPKSKYSLIVGANPSIIKTTRQTFLPPTNSVVVTNEKDLELLRKQARSSQQTAVQ